MAFRTPAALTRLDRSRARGQAKIGTRVLKTQRVMEINGYRLDNIEQSQVRWTGLGMMKEKSPNTVIHSGRKVTMSDKEAKALLEWKPLGERLVMARFNCKYANLSVITFKRSQEMQRMQFKILFMTSYCNSFKR